MKYFGVTLLAIMAMAASASAMNPEEAFDALSSIPNVSMKVNDRPSTIVIDNKDYHVGPFKVASAAGLDMRQIEETGNAAFAVLNQVPLKYMINGACNGKTGAFVYATPGADGKYDLLVASMSGASGDVTFVYTTIDEATRNAFQNAKLTLQGTRLTIIPENTAGSSAFNIKIGVTDRLW